MKCCATACELINFRRKYSIFVLTAQCFWLSIFFSSPFFDAGYSLSLWRWAYTLRAALRSQLVQFFINSNETRWKLFDEIILSSRVLDTKKKCTRTIQSINTLILSVEPIVTVIVFFPDRKLNENRNHSAFWPIGLVSHRLDKRHFIGVNLLTHSQYVFPFIAMIGWDMTAAIYAIDIIFYSGVETSNSFYLFCLFATCHSINIYV